MDIVIAIMSSIVTAYFVYITQKIDKRQDRIEVDIALMKAFCERRFDPETLRDLWYCD